MQLEISGEALMAGSIVGFQVSVCEGYMLDIEGGGKNDVGLCIW